MLELSSPTPMQLITSDLKLLSKGEISIQYNMHYTFLEYNRIIRYINPIIQAQIMVNSRSNSHNEHVYNQTMEIATLETILTCYNSICNADSMHVVPKREPSSPTAPFTCGKTV